MHMAMGRDTGTTVAMAVDIMAPRTTAVDMRPRITAMDIVEFTARLMPTMVAHGITVAMDGIGTTIAIGENSRTMEFEKPLLTPLRL